MSETGKNPMSWLFIAITLAAAVVLFQGGVPAVAGDDHDQAHDLRHAGDIVPLSQLLARPELAGQRVLEAELETEHGRLVYELELLDEAGRVHERYYDAVTGQPLKGSGED